MSGTQGHSSKCICNMAIWLLVNVGHAGHRFGVPFLFEGGLTCMLATQGQIYGGRAGQMPEAPFKGDLNFMLATQGHASNSPLRVA